MKAAHNLQCDLEMTGILLRDGEARSRVLDGEGLTVPVLCLEVESDSITRGHVHVEQAFPAGHMQQCAQAAKAYKEGARVRFQAPTVGIVLLARNCREVEILQQPATTQEAAA